MLHSKVGNTCVWGATARQSSFPRSWSRKWLISQSSWFSEVWYGSPSAFIGLVFILYWEMTLGPSPRDLSFYFHGRSQICMCVFVCASGRVCQTQTRCPAVTHDVSSWTSTLSSSLTKLDVGVNRGWWVGGGGRSKLQRLTRPVMYVAFSLCIQLILLVWLIKHSLVSFGNAIPSKLPVSHRVLVEFIHSSSQDLKTRSTLALCVRLKPFFFFLNTEPHTGWLFNLKGTSAFEKNWD